MSRKQEESSSTVGDEGTDHPTESVAASEDKSHTFRKRRLSLTNLRQAAEGKEKDGEEEKQAGDDDDDDPFDFKSSSLEPPPQQNDEEGDNPEKSYANDTNGDEKAHSFRKRRLSMTSVQEEVQEPPNQRRRRASDASQSSIESVHERLQSRTVHAAELLAHPPSSPSVHQLYQQKSAPPQRQSIDAMLTAEQQPKWKKRHTRQLHEDERILPFPRDIVGTFSCHGVEPIYDDDYVMEDDEDNEWILAAPSGIEESPVDLDKPTTAAKINQDRGGVAFPYGNCARTALFAVYDGKLWETSKVDSQLAFITDIEMHHHLTFRARSGWRTCGTVCAT